jgi:hypothetical protein
MRPFHPLRGPIALLLSALLILTGCTSMVQLRPPYDQKLRIGDRVHITSGDAVIHGQIVYLDANGVVLRRDKVVSQLHPVTAYQYTAQLSWAEVEKLRVDGILDRRGRLIGEEEIKVNRRTVFRRSLPWNMGLVGFAASFGLGVFLQDRIFPPLGQKPLSRMNQGRLAFWGTWVGGTLASGFGGYRLGRYADRRRAIERVEKIRAKEEAARVPANP